MSELLKRQVRETANLLIKAMTVPIQAKSLTLDGTIKGGHSMRLRLERKPPYRLQIVEGEAVKHELPLGNLGLIDCLKQMLDYDDFHSDEDAGGMFDGRDKEWVVWISDDEEPGKGLPVFRA